MDLHAVYRITRNMRLKYLSLLHMVYLLFNYSLKDTVHNNTIFQQHTFYVQYVQPR